MVERDRLEKAIDFLEMQRGELGDEVVNAAVAPLRKRLIVLNQQPNEPFVKPFSEENLADVHNTPSFDGERRVITILFCDVKGSTGMAEKLDPEAWAQSIQLALEYLIEPVQHYGGLLAEVRGDGILAFFGAPIANDDDPQRAVLAGLEILEGVRKFQEEVQRERNLEFNVRVGIHTGLVVFGGMGRNQQREYTAYGDAVNLAARMEQTAQPGTVQISEQTYQLIKQSFNCEPLGQIRVKGKSKPVQTYRVLGLKAKPASVGGLAWQGLHSQLVGREAEVEAVEKSIDRLMSGKGGILSVFGEAGIGKSRLIEEVKRGLPMDHLFWLEGHNLAYEPSSFYGAFQEILRSWTGISIQDEEDLAWDKLANKIKTLFPEKAIGPQPTEKMSPMPIAAEILPYLASLMGLPVKSEYLERVQYLDGEALGKQVFLATLRFFKRLARTKPVILVFEDLQWMDRSSILLLEHLLPLVEQVPLLIASLSRPFWNTPADHFVAVIEKDYSAYYTAIRLDSLSQGDSALLVHNLLENEVLPKELQAIILSKAEGNPFFLEEILRALIDQGVIQRETSSSRRWRVMTQIKHLTIPDTVQRVILARLDRLNQAPRQVVRVASVIGRSFLYRVLQEVAKGGSRLNDHLAELQRIELIQEKQRIPELEYIFKHALVHDATYESILLENRRELHMQVGDAIEKLFADRREEFYGLLAHHYAKAEAWEKAQYYLLRAADQAGRIAADTEASEYYRQAKAAYAQAFGEKWNSVEQAALERKVGEAFYRRGEWYQALDFLLSALAYLEHPLPRSRWGVRAALLLELAKHAGRSLILGSLRNQTAQNVAARSHSAAEEVLLIYQPLEVLLAAKDPELFLLLTYWMLNFCQQNNLPTGIVRALAGLGIVFGEFLSIPSLERHYLRQAVTLAEQLQRPDALGLPYTVLMRHEGIMRGEWETALEYGRRSAGVLRKIGNLGAYSVSILIASTISVWRGEFELALADGQELTQLGREAAETQTLVSGLWVQGFAEQRLGRLKAASSHLKQALEIAETSGNVFLRVIAANELGQYHLLQAHWQTALDMLISNNKYIQSHNFGRAPFPNGMLQIGLATTYLLAAEQSGVQESKAWLKNAKHACQSALRWGKLLRPGRPEAMRLQGRYEWLKGDAPQAQRWWHASLAEAEKLGMPYELGLTHLEIGQRLDKRADMEKANSIFTRIGVERDLARMI